VLIPCYHSGGVGVVVLVFGLPSSRRRVVFPSWLALRRCGIAMCYGGGRARAPAAAAAAVLVLPLCRRTVVVVVRVWTPLTLLITQQGVGRQSQPQVVDEWFKLKDQQGHMMISDFELT
jgi:hypothetical protein